MELTDEGLRLHKKAEPLWEAAQREFERLNGAANITALRLGLDKVVVGDVAAGASED